MTFINHQTIIFVVIILVVLITSGIIYERLWWRQIIHQVKEYISPIINEYNLTNIPVTESDRGALTVNKKKIQLCVRPHYKIDQIAHVLLHEYAHVLNETYGHDENFWKWFAQLLASAQKHNIKIDNYFDKHPYCKV